MVAYRINARSLAHALLMIVALGGVTLMAVMAPNAFQMLGRRYGRNDWWSRREAERRRIGEALKRLRGRRLIRYEERGKETFITVTTTGQRYVRKFQFDEIQLQPVKHWDGKWRIIVFDIPEKQRRVRKAFQDKLRALGFYQLQKSVWVHPHHCHDEIDFLVKFLSADRNIAYLETDSLERKEGEVRKIFGLL